MAFVAFWISKGDKGPPTDIKFISIFLILPNLPSFTMLRMAMTYSEVIVPTANWTSSTLWKAPTRTSGGTRDMLFQTPLTMSFFNWTALPSLMNFRIEVSSSSKVSETSISGMSLMILELRRPLV